MHTHTPLVPKGRRPREAMRVILGSHTVKAFVTSPKEFEVIGIVRMGIEFGLLAITASGGYVRVNGSLVQPLDHVQVTDAIAAARAFGRGESFAMTRGNPQPQPPACRPTVAVRKHRKIDHSLMEHH
jgi:hypothetical protein